MNTDTNFPSGDPLDPQGRLTPQWRMFFLALFNRSGGTSGNGVSALQAQLKAATANIGDLQTEEARGLPVADLAPVYALIHLVEAMAAQAMAAAHRNPDERGESGEASAHGDLMRRIRELEARIDEMSAPRVVLLHDVEAQLAAGAMPVLTDTAQMTNGAGFLVAASNLSDVASAATARGNLALGSGNTPTFAGATLTDGSANNTGTLTVSATSSASGLNLKLTGNGATTPTKYIQIYNGVFKVISSNFGTVLMSLDDTGNLGVNGGLSFAPATTTTSPSAGGAGALPATPAGYATVTIGGTARKIPYY